MLLSYITFLHFCSNYTVIAGITTLVSAVVESGQKKQWEAEMLETASCWERAKECMKEKSSGKKEKMKENIVCRHLSIT